MTSDDRLELLADLPDDPMPDAVATRLDALVARLASERRAGRGVDPTASPDPLPPKSPASLSPRAPAIRAEGSA